MMKLAQEAGDHSLIRWLKVYSYVPGRVIARKIACMLHRTKHTELVDLIDRKLAQAAAVYQDRQFVTEKRSNTAFPQMEKRVAYRKRKLQNRQRSEIYRKGRKQENENWSVPAKGGNAERRAFLYAKDSVEYKVHLMIWKQKAETARWMWKPLIN